MRRKDREMDREFAFDLIDRARYGTLSLAKDGEPYGVALSLAREGETLYFHSAKQGKKIDFIDKNSVVSVLFVGEVKVPELYSEEELQEMAEKGELAVFVRSVFTTEFESALVQGRISEVMEQEEKVKGLRLICEKYTPGKMAYFSLGIEAGLERTRVFKIEIDDISGKRKKYDLSGNEIKS